MSEPCTHDAPRTHYVRHGEAQIASNTIHGCSVTSNGWTPIHYLGELCDQCAKNAGLRPTAIFRPLEVGDVA